MERQRAEALLADGIAAANAGKTTVARDLLLRALDADSENEQAWLWLSSVVQTKAERQICLENVLVLNPENNPARKGLRKLGLGHSTEDLGNNDAVFRRELEPVSLAAAVLYPERQIKEWQWHDDVQLTRSAEPGFATHSGYSDVWETDLDLCAYCAREINDDDTQCPNCGRKLVDSGYLYQRPAAELTIYWVLILGVAQLYFVRILLDLGVYGSPFAASWHAILFVALVFLVIGVFLRRFWAYLVSIVTLLLVLSGMVFGYLTGTGLEDVVSTVLGGDFWGSLATSPVLVLASPILRFIVPMQLIAVLLALLYGIIKIGPEFERVHSRRVAGVDKGLDGASHYYATGKEYAEQDMWASAVLHWRRSVVLEPARPFYQRVLGEAYARLGFYERSLDVLGSAQQLATNETMKGEIEQTITAVRRASASTSTESVVTRG
jgi:tetratricopeptide (TPR) repeat protein